MYTIKEINIKDNDRLKDIIQAVMTEYGACGEGYSIVDNEVKDMYRAYTLPRAKYFTVTLDGEIYGGAGIAQLDGTSDNICELKKMYLLKELRGKGAGKDLLQKCLTAAKEFGYESCYLETLDRMPEARKLYEGAGFIPLDKPLGNTGHYKCNYWYILNLKDS